VEVTRLLGLIGFWLGWDDFIVAGLWVYGEPFS